MAWGGLLGPVAGAGENPFGLVPVTVSPAASGVEPGGEAVVPVDGIALEIDDIRVLVAPGFDAAHLSRIPVCVHGAP